MQKQKKDREVNHMRFNRTKRALAALLAVLTLLSVFGLSGPLGLVREADADLNYRYNPDLAISKASEILKESEKSGDGCATYVSKVLRAGGLTNVKQSGAGDLIDFLNKSSNFGGSIGNVIPSPKGSQISKGDVLAVVCTKGGNSSNYSNGHSKGSGKYYGLHVVIVSKIISDTKVEYYAANNARYGQTLTLSSYAGTIKCSKCGNSSSAKLIAFHFNDSVKNGSYLSKCTEYPTHGTVETTKYTTLKTLPCSASTDPNSKDVTTLGSAQKVEVIALLKNSAGNYWYRALYSGKECYLYAGDTKFKDWLGNDIALSGATNPSTIIKGNGFHIKGTVGAKYNQLNSISAYIYSGSTTSGTPVTSSSVSGLSTKSYSIYNTSLDNQLKFGSLSVGNYTYALNVTCSYHYSNNGTSMTGVCNATPYLIHSNTFSVKNESAPATPTVYFNANGGSVNTSGKTVTVGSTYGTLPTPTRNGYAFDGWYTSASGGSKVTSSTTVSNSSNHTLYAHWNLVYYKVYFNANGGSVSPSSVSIGHGRTYDTLPTPSRTGYAFDGWYTSASGGSKVTSGSTVTYGHTLYAHWSAKLNGWQTANNQTYYYRDGIKVTGWQKIDGRWFYFNSSGAMLKGWQQIGGKWYYFIVQGSVGQSGTMLTGWQHLSGGKTFYFNSSGAMQTGWQKIDGKWYYFLVQGKAGQSGTMLTGWQKLSNKWFYFNSSGVMQTGWQKIGGKWYYFLVQGKAGQSGTMLTGWQKLSNKWYYFNASGAMQNGWQKISNNWYYFNASGVMLTGRQKIDGKWYRFDTPGRLLP